MFKKILATIDDTESSQRIFAQALTLAKANQAELMLLHVLEPFGDTYVHEPYVGIPPSTWETYMMGWKEREQLGLDKLRSLETQAIATGITPEFTQSVGDPGKVICALAKAWDADLVVVGRRGLKGLSELFLGSVSNYVLHHAPCDVLTIQNQVEGLSKI